jgi:hypothetical protein
MKILMKGETMKKIVIGTVIALSVFALSGCSIKSPCAPKTCASACTPAPAPCGCPK